LACSSGVTAIPFSLIVLPSSGFTTFSRQSHPSSLAWCLPVCGQADPRLLLLLSSSISSSLKIPWMSPAVTPSGVPVMEIHSRLEPKGLDSSSLTAAACFASTHFLSPPFSTMQYCLILTSLSIAV
jgi:hypothetical protein